eukprot:CAMPEP_0202910682 /NCGR_PEP_ID=MMETSP1392-20130828/52703_1 /ASSEMBLY_ACC=CAM_ASM_000868 /TAXON_ID=225041 /ORGANISM="Chlamydomonas chlamydogama, Strain SAG 11-48b" /LENGTH=32 /DNA_ID= /DNA_START= /DNA_END= /DNA_ORIENTATION=
MRPTPAVTSSKAVAAGAPDVQAEARAPEASPQ